MMMTLVKKSKTLEVYKLIHLREKMRSFLFKLARIRNGLVLGDKKKGFYGIMNVVLASIIGVMVGIISSICLILYQRMINKTS
jgi:hypothetical protein